MAIEQYKCNHCNAKFEAPEVSCSNVESDIKCPECGSAETERLTAPGNILEYIQNIMRPGFG